MLYPSYAKVSSIVSLVKTNQHSVPELVLMWISIIAACIVREHMLVVKECCQMMSLASNLSCQCRFSAVSIAFWSASNCTCDLCLSFGWTRLQPVCTLSHAQEEKVWTQRKEKWPKLR